MKDRKLYAAIEIDYCKIELQSLEWGEFSIPEINNILARLHRASNILANDV